MKRITYPAACVLQALHKGVGYGFDVMAVTDLPGGTVYAALRRFEGEGLVTSSWETPEVAFGEGRPRRRNYRLTSAGVAALERAAERFRVHRRLFAEADDEAGAEPAR